jgi:DNA-binding HxlR family transcriptional regulator
LPEDSHHWTVEAAEGVTPVPLRSDWSDDACPIARSLDILGDPWTVLILREVFDGNHRFDTIRDSLEIADTVLTKRLRAMVAAGLLEAVPYAGATRPRYDYTLTTAGRDTRPILKALARWGDAHNPRRERVAP